MPVSVMRVPPSERLTASATVTQRVHVVEEAGRWPAFCALAAPFGPGGKEHGSRVIVFANRKDTVQSIAAYCRGQGMACNCQFCSPRETLWDQSDALSP